MSLKYMLPLLLFGGIALALAVGLNLNPREIPSALIGKQVPEFELPPVEGRLLGLADEDLKIGEVTLVNVWASWCVPCRAEHPILMQIQEEELVTIHGLNYKDQPDQANIFLDELGDPYVRTGDDRNGRVGIDWGVYGVPETFIIDGEGRILLKHIGPMDAHDLETKIKPLLKKLAEQS